MSDVVVMIGCPVNEYWGLWDSSLTWLDVLVEDIAL